MEYLKIAPVLSIAGSDCSGGAGIQADIKTILANGCYAMTAITSLTAQNTMGVHGIFNVDEAFLKKQLEVIFDDIPPRAVKIGMVSSKGLIACISETLKARNAYNIVIDPVMLSTSGSKLIDDTAIECLITDLFPMATLITPNIPEAELLSGENILTKDDRKRVGEKLASKYGCAVLMKGGHSVEDADDLLVFKVDAGMQFHWFEGKRINNPNTHGTGCTLSSAIASGLAKGYSLKKSVQMAKDYISEVLKFGIDLGNGNGPLNHGFSLMKDIDILL